MGTKTTEQIIGPYMLYKTSGCEIAEDKGEGYFMGLYDAVGGQVCQDCGLVEVCKAPDVIRLAVLKYREKLLSKAPAKTNAELAKEHGISKRQVAKMRREGKL